jgi:tRNA uridine 5-carbamoylmethylation protein Kti12
MLHLPKLILTRGTPLSGKTTWAKYCVDNGAGKIKRVSKDDLRYMSDNDNRFGNTQAPFYNYVRDVLVTEYLASGFDVIVDETFVQLEDIRHMYRQFVKVARIDIETFPVFGIEALVRRDELRTERNRIGRDELMTYLTILKEQPLADLWKEKQHDL